ncbi:hypothetical protein PXK01_16675 [Phaeobacter sp. PT47_59]|uniref:phage tail terminator protein n=1 Tax=Phaeobacter sp. PT47_59 TaxID=3029979 RepID=UPI0023804FF8|nr:hypothetical protein [Phaeobacter sp. PT47_59]MDE4175799.1 hypothetical protein [Phaeobacter sp. PT47_59]
MLDAIVARLNDQVPDLDRRVEPIADLVEMMRANRLPEQATATVAPAGIKGGKPNDGTGVFTQVLGRGYSVLLIARSTDKTGRKALDRIDPLITDVAGALAGWAPQPGIGVFQVDRGRLLSITKGRLLYELVFSINTELRVTQ